MKVLSASEIRKRFMSLLKNVNKEPLLVVHNYKPQAVIIDYETFLALEKEIKLLQVALVSKGEDQK